MRSVSSNISSSSFSGITRISNSITTNSSCSGSSSCCKVIYNNNKN